MMFSCCHPRLPEEAQVALVLNILCGFGASEIAERVPRRPRRHREADLAREEGARGRAALVRSRGRGVRRRGCQPCRRALYLLFNEGYHGASAEAAVRARAVRRSHPPDGVAARAPAGGDARDDALAALMSLHAARLPARLDAAGILSPLVEQDRSRWDDRLVAQGLSLFEQSAAGARADRLPRGGRDCCRARRSAERGRDRLGPDRLALRSLDDASRPRPSSRSTGQSRWVSATAPIVASSAACPSPIVSGSTVIPSIRPRWARWSSAAEMAMRRGSISSRHERSHAMQPSGPFSIAACAAATALEVPRFQRAPFGSGLLKRARAHQRRRNGGGERRDVVPAAVACAVLRT